VVGAKPTFALQAADCQRQGQKVESVLGDLRAMKDPRVKAAFVIAPLASSSARRLSQR